MTFLYRIIRLYHVSWIRKQDVSFFSQFDPHFVMPRHWFLGRVLDWLKRISPSLKGLK